MGSEDDDKQRDGEGEGGGAKQDKEKEEEQQHEEQEEEGELSQEEEDSVRDKVKQGISSQVLFDADQCREIEAKIDQVVETGEKKEGGFKACTVDRAPLRNK